MTNIQQINVQNVLIKKQCAKTHKYRKLYEPVSPAFIEEKKNIPIK